MLERGPNLNAKLLDFSNAAYYHTGEFPPKKLDYEKIAPALANASASLAKYDAKMTSMVNSSLLLAPLQRQDAISSSRMEGTFSTMEDLYRLEAEENADGADPNTEARDDDIETYLYSRALRLARAALAAGSPLSEHLIRSAHQTLLAFGRGARKRPGAYKIIQNNIGDERTGTVYFVPISHEQLPPAMEALIDYIGNDKVLPLVRTAIAHVEFEALHPFDDGNGRIGRMLITLMLWRLGILTEPHFFVSGYFESNKSEYVARMRAVSEEGDWTGWVVFFLHALHEQACINIDTANRILALYGDMRERFRIVLNSQFHNQALDFVFGNPVFKNDRFVERSGIPAASARALSRRLVDAGLVRTLAPSSGRRAALYAFDPLLTLLNI
jgi:Fic family protein